MEKMTKKEMFNQILTNYDLTQDEKDFIAHEIELLAKKNGKNGKPTKTQIENAKITETMLGLMEPNTEYSVTDIQVDLLDNAYTNQKITALLKNALNEKLVIRTESKGKATYRKA